MVVPLPHKKTTTKKENETIGRKQKKDVRKNDFWSFENKECLCVLGGGEGMIWRWVWRCCVSVASGWIWFTHLATPRERSENYKSNLDTTFLSTLLSPFSLFPPSSFHPSCFLNHILIISWMIIILATYLVFFFKLKLLFYIQTEFMPLCQLLQIQNIQTEQTVNYVIIILCVFPLISSFSNLCMITVFIVMFRQFKALG